MIVNADTLRSFVPISQFSKGHAAHVFNRLSKESQLIVLKNNVPAAVLLSPEEFIRLSEIEENYHLLTLAQERLTRGTKQAVPEAEVLASLGIREEEIDAAEDVEFE